MPAQPPVPLVVSQAASILLRSAIEQSKHVLSSSEIRAEECDFCQYEQHVKTLQAAVQAISHHFDHLIARTSRERNQHCSVSQLPIELLSYILILACDQPAKPTMSDVVRFRGVSTYFRDAIDANAVFWTDVRMGHPLAEEALVKSRNRLIDVRMPRNGGKRLSAFLWDRDPLLEAVASNSSRWRSIHFAGRPTLAEMELFRSPAPQVKDLYIDFQSIPYGTPPDGQPRVDLGEGQPLHHLCLNSVRLSWSSGRLRQLQTLQLYNIEAPPNRAELYTMLAASPRLKRLVLVALGWSVILEGPLDVGPTEPITFPLLAEVSLLDLQTDLTEYLWSIIRAPRAESLAIESVPIHLLSLQQEQHTPFQDTVEGCLKNPAQLEIEIDSERGAIDIRTDSALWDALHPSPEWPKTEVLHRFSLECFSDSVLLDFPIVAEFLAEKGAGIEFRLTVIPSEADPSGEEVDALLRGLTALRDLVDLDIGSFQAGARVVRHLSMEHKDEMGAPVWVCPWLTKLNVRNVRNIKHNDWEALLAARGPRRVSFQDECEPPLRITELLENYDMIHRP
ncbi:hypothetical protein FRC04_007345 [Tulasnella sp. 424]|nr:hypothetical protein FRC04_007345 [Tulasnella sp. 424]KAG8959676.1 hypothetical protein FRC05_007593 [Tulasnella sp. 425]